MDTSAGSNPQQPSVPPANERRLTARQGAFRVPDEWFLQEGDITKHIAWYQQRYGVSVDARTLDTWAALASFVRLKWYPGKRHLILYAYSKGRCPARLTHIDVHDSGLNAHCNRYRMDSVTGVDFDVHATLVAGKDSGRPV